MDFSTVFTYVDYAARIIGFALIFVKCGVKWWYSLIPFVNAYKLSQCADKEEDGVVWCITDFLVSATGILLVQVGESNATSAFLLTVIWAILGIINTIYIVRVYSSLCKIFNVRRWWVVLLIFIDGIVLMIWGFSKKFVPSKKVKQKDGKGEVLLSKAEVLEKGLTINIKERTARAHFKTIQLLKDIRFNIEPGKMVLLLGGSGAGKTTFMNAVTGYEQANAEINVNGTNVYDEFDKVKYEIGFVPQQELLRNTDTVQNTLLDSSKLRMPKEVSKEDRMKRVERIMEVFGLTKVKDSMVSKLSGGQKKRISIAMEYISDPTVFILDEPDSGLDGIIARELMSGLHDISREGKIVMVVTHTPDRAIDLFDEVIVLAKDENRTGRLVFKGPVDEARKFFGVDTMEGIVKSINLPDEGGDGRADELIKKFVEVQNGTV